MVESMGVALEKFFQRIMEGKKHVNKWVHYLNSGQKQSLQSPNLKNILVLQISCFSFPNDCSLNLLPKILTLCLYKNHHIVFCTRAVSHMPVSESICIMKKTRTVPKLREKEGGKEKVCHTLLWQLIFTSAEKYKCNSEGLSREIWLNYLYSPAERWNDEQPGIKLKT